jgi:DNA-binding SARP family transcriptional activator
LHDGQRDHALLASAGTGYKLQIGSDELDLLVFSRLCQAARDAARRGEASQALTLYEQALQVWRSEPLAGIEELRGDPAVVGLSRQWASTVVEYAEAATAEGEHDQVVTHLQALADSEPRPARFLAGVHPVAPHGNTLIRLTMG